MKIILKKGRGSQLSDRHKPATVKHIDSASKNGHFPVYHYFLKPFLKGKILRSSERGVNSILTTILQF